MTRCNHSKNLKNVGPPNGNKNNNGVLKFPNWRKGVDFHYYHLDFRTLVPVLLDLRLFGFQNLRSATCHDLFCRGWIRVMLWPPHDQLGSEQSEVYTFICAIYIRIYLYLINYAYLLLKKIAETFFVVHPIHPFLLLPKDLKETATLGEGSGDLLKTRE